jgi:hypothetical protein
LFHRLVLVNRDKAESGQKGIFPRFAIDANAPTNMNDFVRTAFYIDGTEVALYGFSGPPLTRIPLLRDETYVYEGGMWNYQIGGEGTKELLAQDFAALAAKFLASQWYPGSHQGGNQQGAVVALFNYMLVYGMWANQCHTSTCTAHRDDSSRSMFSWRIWPGRVDALLNSFTGPDGL